MEIPLNGKIFCGGHPYGFSHYGLIEPHTRTLTYIVASAEGNPFAQDLMVPANWIESTYGGEIYLSCSVQQLSRCEVFNLADGIYCPIAPMAYYADSYLMWPYLLSRNLTARKIRSEVWLDRQTGLIDLDGRLTGHVNAIRIEPHFHRITQLVIREGHFWNQKEAILPVTNIHKFENGLVYLNLSHVRAAHLPTVTVH